MDTAIWQNLILMLVAVLCAALLLRQLRFHIRRRKWFGCIEHVTREQRAEAIRRLQLDILPLNMRVTNVVVLFGVLLVEGYLAPRLGRAWMSYSQLAFGTYVLIGFVVVRFIAPIPVDFLTTLTLSHRFDARLYYAWWWPVTVLKAVTHRSVHRHEEVRSFPATVRPRRHFDTHRRRPGKTR
ncbi:hypothetical protein [Burkholderia stagnalis]